MVAKTIIIVFHIFLFLQFHPSIAQTWIRVGYHRYSSSQFPISEINSSLFTHLICAFIYVNSTSYQLALTPSDEEYFFNFTETLKQKKPSVTTLLSIWDGSNGIMSSMASSTSYRKSFIDSTIKVARLYGFHGLDFVWTYPNTISDMFNMGTLFKEWRAAIRLEARNSSQSQLILTAWVYHSPTYSESYPIESIQQYLDWVHILTAHYTDPERSNFTAAHAALFDPTNVDNNTDQGIRQWLDGGLSPNKLVMCLPYYGYAWTLVKPADNGIGAPASGPALRDDGSMEYKEIKTYIERYGANVTYNATYVVNYCTIGKSWIGFDDVEAIKTKISYAKEKRLLGYYVWQVSFDENWVLSKAAAEVDINNSSIQEDTKNGQNKDINNSSVQEDAKNGQNKGHLQVVLLCTAAAVILLLGIILICYCQWRKLKLKGTVDSAKQSNDDANKAEATGDFNSTVFNLMEYTLEDVEAATNGFSIKNKIGQGGYGPVYKGILSNGQEIAVKKLSKTSTQGFEEFKNEVMLTAKLQHVNLVRLFGFCMDREEQILIYEYMPNKSLDFYIFDSIRKYVLDWERRVYIIEGVTQGLLYLQEYSRLSVIHRDLKLSNILLDKDFKPKISDFGIARIFAKDDLEAITSHIIGTQGYVPPEYIQRGIYSTKFDVYSFGVLLLQIISGKRIYLSHGPNESLSLPGYAYELWKDGKGTNFMDPELDDTHSSCKLTRCLQIALLCVQENPIDRPSMLEVFSMLKNDTINMKIPKKPIFLNQNGRHEGKISTQQLEGYSGSTSSINDITVSEVSVR